jgi:hypothetical protein
MRIALWTLLALFVVCPSLMARDIFVNNISGNDRFRGYSETASSTKTGPVRTIAKALRIAKTGDRVVLANTGIPYRESITLQGTLNSGFLDSPFRLVGNGAILDGSAPVPVDRWEHYRDNVFRFRPSRMQYQQLFKDDVPIERVVVEKGAYALPKLEPLTWCLFKGHVYLRVEDGRLPRFYDLSYSSLPVGITVYKVRHVVIRDLVVQGFQVDGVNAHDSAFSTDLINVTARGNGRSGISVGGASRVRVNTCLAGSNGVAQLRTEGWSKADVRDSDLLADTAPAIMRDGGRVIVDDVEFHGDVLEKDLVPGAMAEE